MIKIGSAAVLALCLLSSLSSANNEVIEAKYQKSCKLCHDAGLMGAPKAGDVAAWAPRLAQGNELLLRHIKQGLNAMPPKGTCTDCTDEEFLKLIDKMAKQKSTK